MSYNIDGADTLVFDNVRMKAKDICRIMRVHGDEMPEAHLFEDGVYEEALAALEENGSRTVSLKGFAWYGGGSGGGYDAILVKVIAPLVLGHVEAVFTWEGGDSLSGLIVKDGVVTECDVVQTLVPKKTSKKP